MASPYKQGPEDYHLRPERPMTFTFSTELLAAFDTRLSEVVRAGTADGPPTSGTDVQAAHAKLTSRIPRPTGATHVPASFGVGWSHYGAPPVRSPLRQDHSCTASVIAPAEQSTPGDGTAVPEESDATSAAAPLNGSQDSFEMQNFFRSSCISQQIPVRKSSIRQENPRSPTREHILAAAEGVSENREESELGNSQFQTLGPSATFKRWSMPFRRRRETSSTATGTTPTSTDEADTYPVPVESTTDDPETTGLPPPSTSPLVAFRPLPESTRGPTTRHSMGNLASLTMSFKKASTWTRKNLQRGPSTLEAQEAVEAGDEAALAPAAEKVTTSPTPEPTEVASDKPAEPEDEAVVVQSDGDNPAATVKPVAAAAKLPTRTRSSRSKSVKRSKSKPKAPVDPTLLDPSTALTAMMDPIAPKAEAKPPATATITAPVETATFPITPPTALSSERSAPDGAEASTISPAGLVTNPRLSTVSTETAATAEDTRTRQPLWMRMFGPFVKCT
ncbi:hypothetical protein IWQ60_000343 [Tieghemiomyces parasiticus]|uniref:Uncharacterized protein n=1 Tax=Tieghemiomyces parasiticus TaxID=78921 RepID=A0A9W8AMF4_9FUNG|nr:hypothetical protein IWQ60_000343 [Tieghemiomyces parasiticus]